MIVIFFETLAFLFRSNMSTFISITEEDGFLTTLLATVVKSPSTKRARSGPETRPTAVTPNRRRPSNSEAATAIPMLAKPMMPATARVIRTL